MYDILSNHKICNIRSLASQDAGVANQPDNDGVDLQEIGDKGLYERNTRGLLLIEVTGVGNAGTLDIIVQDFDHQNEVWDADFLTLEQIDAAGLYHYDLKYFNKKIRLNATVGGNAVSWGAKLVTFDATRRPVKQSDSTLLTGTLASDR